MVLVEFGADINYSSGDNVRTPFMVALEMTKMDIVDYFMSTGKLNPNIILDDGTNVLSLFSTNIRFPDYFSKLMIGPIKLNNQIFSFALNQLYSAKNPIYKSLISEVVKIRCSLIEVIAVLAFTATYENDLDFLKFIHNFRIPLYLRSSQGVMLIHIAASRGLIEIVKFLLESGTDINASTQLNLTGFSFKNGYNPITWAAFLYKPRIVVMMLKSRKGHFKTPDSEGRTIFNMNLTSEVKFSIQKMSIN